MPNRGMVHIFQLMFANSILVFKLKFLYYITQINHASCKKTILMKILLIYILFGFSIALSFENKTDFAQLVSTTSDIENKSNLLITSNTKPDTLQTQQNQHITFQTSEQKSNPVVQNYNQSLDLILQNTKFIYDDYKYILTSPTRIDKKSAIKLGSILATFGLLYYKDQEIYDFLNRHNNDRVYKKVLQVGNFFEPSGLTRNTHPYYIGGFFVGYLLKNEHLQEASVQLLESMIFEGNTRVQILHKVIGRSRPNDEQGPYFFEFDGDRSFPSGHTSNIFQLATVLSHHVDHWAFSTLAYGIATTVGFQRIDYKSHWPSDVFMGAVYGIAVSKAIIYMHESRKARIVPGISIIENKPIFGITYNLDSF